MPEAESVTGFVDRSAEHIGLMERTDLLPKICMIEFDVTGITVASRVVRLCFGDWIADGRILAVDKDVPITNLPVLRRLSVGESIVRDFYKIQRRRLRPEP